MARTNWKQMHAAVREDLFETSAALVLARGENRELRQLNAEWAAESARLKRELLKLKGRSSANHRDLPGQSYREAAIAYCAEHGCANVTLEQLRAAG